jgi:Zn-dependent peptidase ImmA (M78 family)
MLAEIPEEQARMAVEGIAQGILREAGILAPPVDAFELAQRLGILVARDGASDTRARFVRFGGGGDSQGARYVAEDPRPERRQWAVAHEVGESEAYRVFAELGVSAAETPAAAREAVANRLAGCLLLPYEWFRADGYAVEWDLFALKQRYATASHEMIARRMLEMSPAVIITLLDQGRKVWRKSNRLFRAPPMTPAELDVWKVAHESGEAAQADHLELPDGIDDVRAWPVHEVEWKREIVRTELSGEW